MTEQSSADQRIAGLSASKQALLQRLLTDKARPPVLGPRDGGSEGVSLTPTQERLWLLDRIAPERTDYHVAAAFGLQGPLDEVALSESLNTIVGRHAALRSYIVATRGGPELRSYEPSSNVLALVDLGDIAEPERVAVRRSRLHEEATRRFDLERGPLFRATLFRDSDDYAELILVGHHIALDGWSLEIFARELAICYRALVNGRNPELPALALQFNDYAAWMRERLASGEFEPRKLAWKERLGPAPAVLRLPGADRRPGVAVLEGAIVSFELDATLAADLRVLARSIGATLFVVTMAAFSIVMGRWSGQREFLIGFPVANRERRDLEALIGCFVNTLVARARLDDRGTFVELVERLHREVIEACEDQGLPFDKLVQGVGGPRDASRTPLIGASFSLQQFPAVVDLEGVSVTPIELPPTATPIDLSWILHDDGTRIAGTVQFCPALFSEATIRRRAAEFVEVLRVACERPRDRVLADPAPASLVELTPNQRLIWLGQSMSPDVPLYNECLEVRFDLSIDPDRFAAAFEQVVATTDAMRMRIVQVDGAPRLGVTAEVGPGLEYVDLSRAADPEAAYAELRDQRVARKFDLGQGIYESVLLRLHGSSFVWLLCVHHVAVDARSFEILVRRLASAYEGQLVGPGQAAAEAPSFFAWAAKKADAERASVSAAAVYWREKLAGRAPRLAFYGRVRDSQQYGALRTRRCFGSSRMTDIDGLCRSGEVPRLFSRELGRLVAILTAAFATLSRITGADDLCIGVPFHNRGIKSTEALVGPLMAVYPIRVEVRPADTLAGLFERVAKVVTGALLHADHVVSNPPDHPHYEVIVNYLEQDFGGLGDLPVSARLFNAGTQYDALDLVVSGSPQEVVLELAGVDDVFGDARSSDTATRFLRLLDTLTHAPKTKVHEVDVQTEHDLATISTLRCRGGWVHRWTDVMAPIEAAAARDPEHIAVVDGDRTLGYGALIEGARRLAGALQRSGVAAGHTVGVCMGRSADLVTALLGVLTAGAAYLPLDPELPSVRMEQILESARPALVICDSHTAGVLGGRGIPVLRVEETGDAMPLGSSATPRPNDLAYVMYTSGSTGRPKGVMIERGALARYVETAGAAFGLNPSDRVLQFAAPSFDTSAEEIFGCLTRGATLVLRGDALLDRPEVFWQRCQDQRITVLDLPTSWWTLLAHTFEQRGAPIDPGSVRLVIIGGEEATAKALRAWNRGVGARLRTINTYGPTEATIVSTSEELSDSSIGKDSGRVCIGRPEPGVEAYVLGPCLQPVPVGVGGALYLAGSGLARGYVGDPRQTAARFVPNPYSRKPGARMYRTGDVVRCRPDAKLEFLGREDRQIKLRGYRIDPREIEDVLERVPGAQRAAVFVRQVEPGADRLAAYVVSSAPESITVESLRVAVATRLPSYMVPSDISIGTSMPLNASGKVDVGVLQTMVRESPPVESAAPLRGAELDMAKLWGELLERAPEEFRATDSFFDVGGHSLLAAILVGRIDERFGVDLPLRMLFDRPTLAAIAAFVAERPSTSREPPVAMPRRAGDVVFACSASQRSLWFLDQLHPGNPAHNVPTAVRIRGEVDEAALVEALRRVIERHEVLRTRFEACDGEPMQVIETAVSTPVTSVDLRALSAEQAEQETLRIASEDSLRGFRLDRGLPLRAIVVRHRDGLVMLFDTHHIACDGWSAGILARDLSAHYVALRQSTEPELPALPMQYADFAQWQRGRRSIWDAQLAHWRRVFTEPVTDLRLGSRGDVSAVSRGQTLYFGIPSETTAAIRQRAREHDVTAAMLCLASFVAWLYEASGQADLTIGTPVAGRTIPEVHDLIGCFVNTVVLRLQVRRDDTFAELLARVREAALEAYSNQEVPFDEVVRAVAPNRREPAVPLFRVMFTYLNEPTRRHLGDAAAEWEPLTFDRGMANRDLTVRVEDRGTDLRAHCEFDSSRFDLATIEQFVQAYVRLLSRCCAEPDQRIFEPPAEAPNPVARAALGRSFEVARRTRRRGSARPSGWVTSEPVSIAGRHVWVVRPTSPDLDPIGWASEARAWIEQELDAKGALLLRGFALGGHTGFERFVRSVDTTLLPYDDRSTPRTQISGGVYTATEYPAEQWICLHNEKCYAHAFPLRLWFYCDEPARRGGNTPIADARELYRRIDPDIVAKFERKHVTYVRNFGHGVDLSWEQAFGTTDRDEVERLCAQWRIEPEWYGAGCLRTRQTRRAVARHPKHGDPVWFNSAHMFHPASLPLAVRSALGELLTEDELPRHASFGDGEPIPSEVIRNIRDTWREISISFPWQRGDVMLLDNVAMAHGRDPFEGDRTVYVAMTRKAMFDEPDGVVREEVETAS